MGTKKRYIAIGLVAAVILIVVAFLVFIPKNWVSIPNFDNQSIVFIGSESLKFRGRSPEKVKFYLNNNLFSSGEKEAYLPIEYLNSGSNTIKVDYNGKIKERQFNYQLPTIQDNKTDKAVSLLLPNSAEPAFDDWDNDGVNNEDELNIYKTDPNKDFSNTEGISDLAFANKEETGSSLFTSLSELSLNSDKVHIQASYKGITPAELRLSNADIDIAFKTVFNIQGITENAELIFNISGWDTYDTLIKYGYGDDIDMIPLEMVDGDRDNLKATITENGNYILINLKDLGLEMELNLDAIKGGAIDESRVTDLLKSKRGTEVAFVIDNSNSMYSYEEATGKPVAEASESDLDQYGKDTEFKRISLMNELLDELAPSEEKSKIKVSVIEFGSDALIKCSNDTISNAKAALSSINTLMENGGTAIEIAGVAATEQFSKNLFGKKTMVLLTDGRNSGGLFSDNAVEQMLAEMEFPNIIKRDNIQLIVVAFGGADKAGLEAMLERCGGGTLLFVDDADTLSILKAKILAELTSGNLVNIYDPENIPEGKDVVSLADSGFRVSVDGFDIENFNSTISDGGNCYGFSLTSKMIYEGHSAHGALKYLENAKIKGSLLDNIGSNLMVGTNIIPKVIINEYVSANLQKGKAYSINLDNYQKYVDYSYRKNSIIGGNKLLVNDEAEEEATKLGFDIIERDSNDTVDGTKIKKYEAFIFDSFKAATIDSYPDGYYVLSLIARHQMAQANDMIAIKKEKPDIYTYNTFIEELAGLFAEGKPIPLTISCELGKHSVLAYRLFKDPYEEVYYLALYDSNVPGQEKIAKITLNEIMDKGILKSKIVIDYIGNGLKFNEVDITHRAYLPLNSETALYEYDISKNK